MKGQSGQQPRVCRRVIYSGRVQGVGFRATAVSTARRYPFTGYVKNRPDGTVEVVADGPPEVVDRFLEDVEAAFAGNIRSSTAEELQPRESFRGFDVRF